MDSPCHSSEYLVLGAGTWGCSIALELARRGYQSITVLDGSPFPSPVSAGNDLNKIVEEAGELHPSTDTDADYFWKRVTKIAMHMWKHDHLFAPCYYETGFIMAAVGDEAYKKCLEYEQGEHSELVALNSMDDFHGTMPKGVLQGQFPGWRGFWEPKGAGWVFARGALRAMHSAAVKLGVEFATGDDGRVEELLRSSSNDSILGARTLGGSRYLANHTILATGACSDLFLDFKGQLRPTAWTLAHLPLLPEEVQHYRNLPVLYGVDRGFFIEP
ncbi:hypothetical protein NX059_003194 [Plenodomus lindquistii]|nr:hypothetical protein NX059_003194 [Plenodomus lindquistii]